MRLRAMGLLGALLLASAGVSAQNTVQWNRVLPADEDIPANPPAVRVWLEQRVLGFGDPVRVGFAVDEDAFVVVAKVDSRGNLAVLFPSNRNRVTLVKAGEENYIRGARTGATASFLAVDQPGSTGYVFAIASRTPIDLSRLTIRDFSSWVTGVSLGPSGQRYIGDPYRVVQRFARLVSFSPDAEFDYDLEFFSVDQPQFAYASSRIGASFCNGLAGSRTQLRAMLSDFDFIDTMGYGTFLTDCWGLQNCLMPMGSLGWGLPFGFFPGQCGLGQFVGVQVAGQDAVVTPPPVRGTGPLNPWAADSVQRPNLDRSGESRQEIDRVRPAPVASGVEDLDISFSIPSRALRGMRERTRSEGDGPAEGRPRTSDPLPNPGDRLAPVVADNPTDWVRPPRALDQPDRNYDMPGNRGRREAFASDREPPVRGFDYGPPPRTGSAMFDRDPGFGSGYNPGSSDFGGRNWIGGREWNGGSTYSPPPMIMDHRPMTNPTIYSPSGGTGSPAPVRSIETSSPPPPSAPPASGGSGSSGTAEKKPGL